MAAEVIRGRSRQTSHLPIMEGGHYHQGSDDGELDAQAIAKMMGHLLLQDDQQAEDQAKQSGEGAAARAGSSPRSTLPTIASDAQLNEEPHLPHNLLEDDSTAIQGFSSSPDSEFQAKSSSSLGHSRSWDSSRPGSTGPVWPQGEVAAAWAEAERLRTQLGKVEKENARLAADKAALHENLKEASARLDAVYSQAAAILSRQKVEHGQAEATVAKLRTELVEARNRAGQEARQRRVLELALEQLRQQLVRSNAETQAERRRAEALMAAVKRMQTQKLEAERKAERPMNGPSQSQLKGHMAQGGNPKDERWGWAAPEWGGSYEHRSGQQRQLPGMIENRHLWDGTQSPQAQNLADQWASVQNNAVHAGEQHWGSRQMSEGGGRPSMHSQPSLEDTEGW